MVFELFWSEKSWCIDFEHFGLLVGKIAYFCLKTGTGLKKRATRPHHKFRGVPPPGNDHNNLLAIPARKANERFSRGYRAVIPLMRARKGRKQATNRVNSFADSLLDTCRQNIKNIE